MTTRQLVKVDRYHAVYELDESGMWLAGIEEIPQVHTFGRTLGKAREYLVDALALWLGIPVVKAKGMIQERPAVLPSDVRKLVDEAVAAKVVADSAANVASEVMSAAAFGLTRVAHLSLRDASELLGVSHQRVQQLVAVSQLDQRPLGNGAQGIAHDVARSLKEYLPGGSKEDLGVAAAAIVLGVTFAWAQTRD